MTTKFILALSPVLVNTFFESFFKNFNEVLSNPLCVGSFIRTLNHNITPPVICQ